MTAGPLVELIAAGCRLVITHGNGPQVGAALLRSELAAAQAYPLPYDCCVAATQGEIGYVLQYALWRRMQQVGLRPPSSTVITQVRVDPPRSRVPPSHQAGRILLRPASARRSCGGKGVTRSSRSGPRGSGGSCPRPFPARSWSSGPSVPAWTKGSSSSPPGAGAVPVFGDQDVTKGVEAVIDKDLTSALLAVADRRRILAIVTTEDRVCLDHGTPRAAAARSAHAARRPVATSQAGQFPEGSMGPKIQAALLFLERGGRAVVITDRAHLVKALEGQAGTRLGPTPAGRPGERLLH